MRKIKPVKTTNPEQIKTAKTSSAKTSNPKQPKYQRTEEKILMKMDGKSRRLTVYRKGARGIRYCKDGSEYKLCSEIERANKKREEGRKSTYQKKNVKKIQR
jgi:hypothetical protein